MAWQKVLYLKTYGGVSRAQFILTQPSEMELLAKTVNSLSLMAVFTETFFFDVWLGSDGASAISKGAPQRLSVSIFWRQLLFKVVIGTIKVTNKIIY